MTIFAAETETIYERIKTEKGSVMCGRVYMAPANQELREIVKEMNESKAAEYLLSVKNGTIRTEGEIRPSDIVPALALNRKGEKRVFPMKWGFSVHNRLIINARSETAAQKPAFSESWDRQRCIIPASWYFEWDHNENKKNGQKYALKTEQSDIIWLAGLYRMEEGFPAFVILTRSAAENLTWMHDRMPVLFSRETAGEWIRPDIRPEKMIGKSMTEVRWEKAI